MFHPVGDLSTVSYFWKLSTMSDKEAEVRNEAPATQLGEFLEGTPPGSITEVEGLARTRSYQGGGIVGYPFAAPDIQLHCGHESCNGTRFFRRVAGMPDLPDDKWEFFYVTYKCSNRQKTEKTFSLAARREPAKTSGQCFKFGELPEYGPPTPSRLVKLIGPDRELFLKGRRCENQGLGIGAFVYYRRVVENQKNRILDEVINQKLNAAKDAIDELEAAKAEIQFSKALANVKTSIPQALLINGHNPLALLHSALSDGLHDRNDSQCLEIASSIRIVLGELSERLAQALKDEAELTRALSHLMSRRGG
jgi:hypothetical protein